MEIIFWAAIIGLWWLLSATVLLPLVILLKYNKHISNLWFPFIYMVCLKMRYERRLVPLRKKQFELLKENLAGRDERKPLKVLEIGIGQGANLEFYPENSHLTALDRNASFETYLGPNRKKFPHVVYERKIISVAENMKEVEDSSMDVVVSTYVLCSVTSVKDTLKEVKRVLKPGGKYVFMEHVSHAESDWAFTLQKIVDPIWRIYGGGCCIARSSGDDIKRAGFSDVICKKIFPDAVPIIVRSHILGIATK